MEEGENIKKLDFRIPMKTELIPMEEALERRKRGKRISSV